MAAGVVEALELGADTLLFDEDSCATNFLIRDRRMQKLISADPITPLIFKVRAMLRDHGCSSIFVIGGCGDYCDVADLVLEMRHYQCHDITAAARLVAAEIPSAVSVHEVSSFGNVFPRWIDIRTLPSTSSKIVARKRAVIEYGEHTLDLSAIKQLVHESQTRTVAKALRHISSTPVRSTLSEYLQALDALLENGGLDSLSDDNTVDGFLARPRTLEVGMAVNRLRTLGMSYDN